MGCDFIDFSHLLNVILIVYRDNECNNFSFFCLKSLLCYVFLSLNFHKAQLRWNCKQKSTLVDLCTKIYPRDLRANV